MIRKSTEQQIINACKNPSKEEAILYMRQDNDSGTCHIGAENGRHIPEMIAQYMSQDKLIADTIMNAVAIFVIDRQDEIEEEKHKAKNN